MSKYKVIQTQFTSWALLEAALKACEKPVEFAASDDLPLFGYKGDERPERAKAVIRRRDLESAANDLGFGFNAETGQYDAIISEWDQSSPSRAGMVVLDRVKHEYTTALATQEAEARGYRVEQVREHGVTRLVCVIG